jgi:Ca-activated chloride channel family protein
VSNDAGPLAGVSVRVKGTTTEAVTGAQGLYTVAATADATLVFAFAGMQTQEIAVEGRSVIDVVLRADGEDASDGVIYDLSAAPVALKAACIETAAPLSPSPVRRFHAMAEQKELADVSVRSVAPPNPYDDGQEEAYDAVADHSFVAVAQEPLSTFSADVDAASYANMRRYLHRGQLPPRDAIRTEELVNYFTYDYPQPRGADPVSVTAEAGECPWNPTSRLVRIGIKAKEIADEQLPASHLVFLIDVSGSMYGSRLELVKSSLKLLVNNLRGKDRVAIVVYAGAAGEVLPSTSGDDKQKIRTALDNLTAGGSTAGGAGIRLAYQIARRHFLRGGNNRVILCTDGDFNVGVSTKEELEALIEQERQSGVFLTVLGYGMGNYKDRNMQALAQKGNGNHAYIDHLQEANRVLVEEFGGTLYAVAKDVKLQVEFNPAKVQAYRLIGYETRRLRNEDFNDDTKDAGEMGAGHTVTALYEVVPVGVKNPLVPSVDSLKYQRTQEKPTVRRPSPELLTVKIRYKRPDEDVSRKIELPLTDTGVRWPSGDFRFAASVAMFGQLLRHSAYTGNADCRKVVEWAEAGSSNDKAGYRREFIRLVKTVEGMDDTDYAD